MNRKTSTVLLAAAKTTTATEPSSRTAPTRSSLNPASCCLLAATTHSGLLSHTATCLSATSGAAVGEEPSSNSSSSSTKYRGLFREGVNRLFQKQGRELGGGETIKAPPRISPIEPYLHMLPDDLYRYYRPLPNIVRALSVCLATGMAIVTTNRRKLQGFSFLFVRQIAIFLFKSVAWTLIAQVVLQDTLFADNRPSRVTMKSLVQKYFLPSSLSKYKPITIDPITQPPASERKGIADSSSTTSSTENEPFTLGVHYLQYDNDSIEEEEKVSEKDDDSGTASASSTSPSKNPNNPKKRSFDAMYFQHGFGASSLSWLPVLPTLAKQMNARVALGHDTVGFGFTDRPKDRRWYRPKQAARIAQAILAQERKATLPSEDDTKSGANDAPAPICLVGHSMGSRSILRMATQLPRETPKLIILSSPALGLISPNLSKTTTPSSKPAQLASSLSTALSKKVFRPAANYVLSRVVGTRGSWRKGLESAWGDPDVTEDSDVLRYSWPSIGCGWEEGILNFAGAQVLPVDDELDDDFILMRTVLDLPHTKVLIILGSKDRVIPTRSVERFLEQVVSSESGENNNDVPIVEMEGLGHCAFEEDREAFCETVEQLVRDHWDTRS